MKTIFSILLLTVFMVSSFASPVIINVAKKGSASGDGSESKPFATLQQAVEKAFQIVTLQGYPQDGIQIIVGEGEYQLSNTIQLSNKLSGNKNAPLTISALNGVHAQFFGGSMVDAKKFKKANSNFTNKILNESARSSILELDLKAMDITDYGKIISHGWTLENPKNVPPMTLTMDGQRMQLARWPNSKEASQFLENRGKERNLKGMVSYVKVIEKGAKKPNGNWYNDDSFINGGGTIQVAFDRMNNWSKPENIFIDGVLSAPWEWTYNQIKSIDKENKTITLKRGEVNSIKHSGQGGSFFYFENIPEELDTPGEYYIDRAKGILYFYPPNELDGKNIVLSTIDKPVFQIDNASNILIKNLSFNTGRNFFAIVSKSKNVSIEDCTIANFTKGGILLEGESCLVKGCHFYGIGGAPVDVEGGNLKTLGSSGIRVEYNEIHDFAWNEKSQVPGVRIQGVGVYCAHNKIYDAPHFALKINGNDHIIEYNEIFDLPKYHLFDGGSIYVNTGFEQEQRGNLFQHNYFHDIPTIGIYWDHLSSGNIAESNLFYNVGYIGDKLTKGIKFTGITINGGGQHQIKDNLFVECGCGVINSDWAALHVFNERVMSIWQKTQNEFPNGKKGTPWEKYFRFEDFLNYKTMHDFQYKANFISGNVFYNPTKKFIELDENEDGIVDELNALELDSNVVVKENPGLVSVENRNFGLRKDAKIYQWIPGFKDIEFEKIGLVGYLPGVK